MLKNIGCHNILIGSSLSGKIAVQTTKFVIVGEYQINIQSFSPASVSLILIVGLLLVIGIIVKFMK